MGIYYEALKKVERESKQGSQNGAAREFTRAAQGNGGIGLPVPTYRLPVIPKAMRRDFERLLEHIEYLLPSTTSRVIALCGSIGQEGTSTIAGFLSVLFAERGNVSSVAPAAGRVTGALSRPLPLHNLLVIDANLHSPALHRFFRLEKAQGVTEIVQDELELHHATKWLQPNNFGFISAGRSPRSVPEIFKSQRFHHLLRRARETFAAVIVDCAAVNLHSDILAIAPILDGALVVARAGVTPIAALQRSRQMLEDNHGKLLGVVLNRQR